MGKAMGAKAMKGSGNKMTKGGLCLALSEQCELKRAQCSKALDCLASIAAKEVKSNDIFTLPGVCRIKTRVKPATKAGKREVFGKEMFVKAKPARTVVKAFAVAALK